MIKITCKVESYDDPVKPSIIIHSHWHDNQKVILEIGEQKITVKASEMEAAIKNCTNTAKW